MKRLLSIFLVIIYVLFLFPIQANAQTLGDFKRELDALEKKEKETKEELNLTNEEIQMLSREISNIYGELEEIVVETTQKEKEIIELEKKIKKADEEIKKIMSAYQISSGDSFYLEYLFGATTITDFIIRYSVTEQLTKHNNKIMKEMNENIEENKKIQKELAAKEIVLKNKQISMREKQSKLENSVLYLEDTHVSVLDEIRNAREVIKLYESAGCKDNESLSTCAVKTIPSDTKLILPLERGYITSEYTTEMRCVYIAIYGRNVCSNHLAIDISSGTGTGTKVFASANGKVTYAKYEKYGGNKICIHHNINGIGYTTCYAHLHAMYVKPGDIVSKYTVIGLMGSTGELTTGPHIHFEVGKGLKDTSTSYLILNPSSVINIPSSWSNRNQ